MSHERKETFGSYLKFNGVTTSPIPDDLISGRDVHSCLFFPNNRVALVSKAERPLIYDLATNEIIHQFDGDFPPLFKLDDHHFLVINGRSQTIKKINIHTFKEEDLGKLKSTNISYHFLLLPNNLLAYYNEKCFGLYDLSNKVDIDYQKFRIRKIYLSANNEALYIFKAVGIYCHLQIYDIKKREFKPCHVLQNFGPWSIVGFNQSIPLTNNNFLVTTKPDYTDLPEVWDLNEEKSTLKITPPINEWLVRTLVELPDNVLAITGQAYHNSQGYIWFYDLKTGKKFDNDIILDNISRITHFSYQPGDRQLTCLGYDENGKKIIANFDIGLGKYLTEILAPLDQLSHPKKVVLEYLGWMNPKDESRQEALPKAENKSQEAQQSTSNQSSVKKTK